MGKVQRSPVACVFVDDDSQIGNRLFYRYVENGCNITGFKWKQLTFTFMFMWSPDALEKTEILSTATGIREASMKSKVSSAS